MAGPVREGPFSRGFEDQRLQTLFLDDGGGARKLHGKNACPFGTEGAFWQEGRLAEEKMRDLLEAIKFGTTRV